MKVFIASDHAGYSHKSQMIEELKKQAWSQNWELIDLGTHSDNSVHYPDYALSLCQKITQEASSIGILICGSGIGMSIMANRFKGIRAALCRTVEDAHLSKAHNNANVLCLGSRTSTLEECLSITKSWAQSTFAEGRHQERVTLLDQWGSSL